MLARGVISEIDKPSGRAALARAMGIDGHRTSTSTTSSPSPTGLPGPCRPLLVAVVPDATVLTAYPELTAAVVGDPPAALGLLVGAADEDLRANVHSPDWPPSGAGWRTLRIDADGTGRLDTGEPSTAFDSMVGDGTAGSAHLRPWRTPQLGQLASPWSLTGSGSGGAHAWRTPWRPW